MNVTLEDPTMHEEYLRRAAATNAEEAKAGFNLILPDDILLAAGEVRVIDLKVRCELLLEGSYILRPRPLMVNSPLRMIHAGNPVDEILMERAQDGSLKVQVHNTATSIFEIWRGERYFQICFPTGETSSPSTPCLSISH